ncbi:MAG: GGDEF domain-containing protein, partial [Shewanella sp.]
MANSLDFDQALNELDVLLQSDLSTAQKKLAEYEKEFSKLTSVQQGRLRIDRAIGYFFTGEYAKAL